jgi:plastocyanin
MRRTAIALALIALLLAGCSDDGGGKEGDNAATTSTSTTSTTLAPGNPQDTANTITIKDFSFDPAEVTVTQRAVALKLKNTGSTGHTFTIDSPKIDVEIGAGSNSEVLVDLGQQTEVVFYCRFHRSRGMQGKLVVKP